MSTREIAPPEWRHFFDAFSRDHLSTTAVVQVISPDLGAQEEARKLPFVGVSFDPKGSAKGSIALTLGTDPEDHVEHRILNPVHVWLKTGDVGENDTLEIETADGFKTIVQLQPIPALPE
ncbi:MAG: hypothetical protein JWL77_3979 [Chthonomonadaceae bacterium]|nr:hypothetical protein [Chthonomonadaceae bacterium]